MIVEDDWSQTHIPQVVLVLNTNRFKSLFMYSGSNLVLGTKKDPIRNLR